MHSFAAKLLAVVLVTGFHFSGCTGNLGMLSIALASETVQEDEVPMSRSIVSCTKDDSSTKSETTASGCRDGKSCLQRLHHASTERLTESIQLGSAFFPLVATILQVYDSVYSVSLDAIARAGPLYEEAPLVAKALMKRE